MGRKTVSGILLTLLLTGMLTLITSRPPAVNRSVTKVSISPKTLTGPPGWINVNATFTVNVTVSDVIDLIYWQAGLSFNPTVLQCINLTEGPFLKAGGDTVWQPGTIDNEEGLITPHGASLTDDDGVSGNGTLAFIAFKVKDAGVSNLRLEDVILLDSDYDKIKPVVLQHGHFNLPPGPEPKPPNAFFFYYPLTPYVNETVTFNASESTANGGTIENYEWDFDDGSQDQDMIVNHTYTSPGEYNVTLTVTDNKNLTDTFSRLLTVLPLLLGASIDVYTQRDGKGLNESSDAFAPQELVALTAYLTYNGTPVASKPVTFRVYLPNGTVIWSRTSETDDDGLAFIAYLTQSKPVFGLYSITASASVGGETVSDTIWFGVGWLVEVLEVLPCDRNGVPKNQFEIGEPLYLGVKLENIRFHSTGVELTVAVLDVFLQPVAFEADEYVIAPNQTTVLLNPGAIPEWAYVGNATAHVNAFQWHGGPAYCPEVSASFMITIPIPDVAVVSVAASSFEIYLGQPVNITVSVLNEYYRPQSFNVTICAKTTVIQTLTVSNLTPYIQTNFTFIWHTHTVSPGNYTISAVASVVPGEIDTTDNINVDGTVHIHANGNSGVGGESRQRPLPLLR